MQITPLCNKKHQRTYLMRQWKEVEPKKLDTQVKIGARQLRYPLFYQKDPKINSEPPTTKVVGF